MRVRGSTGTNSTRVGSTGIGSTGDGSIGVGVPASGLIGVRTSSLRTDSLAIGLLVGNLFVMGTLIVDSSVVVVSSLTIGSLVLAGVLGFVSTAISSGVGTAVIFLLEVLSEWFVSLKGEISLVMLSVDWPKLHASESVVVVPRIGFSDSAESAGWDISSAEFARDPDRCITCKLR